MGAVLGFYACFQGFRPDPPLPLLILRSVLASAELLAVELVQDSLAIQEQYPGDPINMLLMRSQVYRDLLAAYQENMASGFYAQFQPHTQKELLQALYELSTQGHHSLHVIGDKVSMLLQGKQLQTSAFSPGRPAPAPTPAPITYEQVIHTLNPNNSHSHPHSHPHSHSWHAMPCHAYPHAGVPAGEG